MDTPRLLIDSTTKSIALAFDPVDIRLDEDEVTQNWRCLILGPRRGGGQEVYMTWMSSRNIAQIQDFIVLSFDVETEVDCPKSVFESCVADYGARERLWEAYIDYKQPRTYMDWEVGRWAAERGINLGDNVTVLT